MMPYGSSDFAIWSEQGRFLRQIRSFHFIASRLRMRWMRSVMLQFGLSDKGATVACEGVDWAAVIW
jgi:hypothetical protein